MIKNDNNNIYFNVNLTNDSNTPMKFSIYNRLDSPIINNPSEYECSIVKFHISAEYIPLFWPVIPNAGTPLVTNMSITLAYGGVNFQQFINIDANESKNGVYNYGVYLDHLNVASGVAFGLLKAAFPGASGTVAPLFFLDAGRGLISMYVEDLYLESNVNRIRIGMNQPLSSIMNLPVSVRNGAGIVGGLDDEIAVRGYCVLTPVAPRTGYPFVLSTLSGNILGVSQEFKSMGLWNELDSILFTTTAVPVNKEYLPTIYGSNQNANVSGDSMSVLTEFDVQTDNDSPTRGNIEYTPTAEYRMISLSGHVPLTAIDANAYYKTNDGKIRPIYIPTGQLGKMKILFRRKVPI